MTNPAPFPEMVCPPGSNVALYVNAPPISMPSLGHSTTPNPLDVPVIVFAPEVIVNPAVFSQDREKEKAPPMRSLAPRGRLDRDPRPALSRGSY